jgi:hypothetical protein
MHPIESAALGGLLGLGLGFAVARAFTKWVVVAFWLVQAAVGYAVFVWADNQPGMVGLQAGAFIVFGLLPALAGSMIGGLVAWLVAWARDE